MSLYWVFLSASGAGFTIGSVLLKRFVDTGNGAVLGFAVAVFVLSNVAYIRVLTDGLGRGAVLSSMCQVVALSAIAALFFDEDFSPYQIAGVGFAVASIWLFSLSDPSRI